MADLSLGAKYGCSKGQRLRVIGSTLMSLGHPGHPPKPRDIPQNLMDEIIFPMKRIDSGHKVGAHPLCLDKCHGDIQPKFEIFGMFADDSVL